MRGWVVSFLVPLFALGACRSKEAPNDAGAVASAVQLRQAWTAAGTKESRLALADQTERERGVAGVIDLLVEAAPVPGPGWDEVAAHVKAKDAVALEKGLWSAFAGGEPLVAARVARNVDLADTERLPAVAAKANELAQSWREPRTAAVLLRTVLAADANEAGGIACKAATARPKEEREADDAFLAEAAYLALSVSKNACDAAALERGLEPVDHPSLRCGEKGPLGWSSATKQDEPLCTSAQLAPVLDAEKNRAAADVFAASESRAALFAYAALLERAKLPAAFVAAHERRRFTVVQPKTPSCETEIAPKTPCACDEATLRQNAARSAPGHVVVGVCAFDVDAKEKKITNVVRFTP